MYGVACVIGVITGLVLDFVVLSLYCHSCESARVRCHGTNTAAYRQWAAQHDNCSKNYSGSSGGMEMAAAKLLWKRSEARSGFRYTTLLSDGDAKTHSHLCSLGVYGDTSITKEECTNHVAKRLGTALRKFATQSKKGGVTLGGRGHGMLTQATITKLTAYYGKAIRAHPHDLDGMIDAVFATFDNTISSDDKPQHGRCPEGSDSWCFYQRTLAGGVEPGRHYDNIGTPLSAEVAEHVKPVYVRLGHADLLRRCLQGATQNSNESLHAKIWAKCPKTGFVGLQRLTAAVCAVIAEFNGGVEVAVQKLCVNMNVAAGSRLLASAKKADTRRLRQSMRRAQTSTKAARTVRKVARAAASDTSVDYSPGAF